MIIDTHCHFDMMPDPENYIENIERKGDITIGMTNLPSHFQIGQPHVIAFRHVRLALGLHPLLAEENQSEVAIFGRLLDKTSYIGEIGLDFSNEGYRTREKQIEVLSKLLTMLKGKNKIISVHSRRAEKELLSMLKENEIKNVIFHWYSGAISLIPSILDCGYYFSINEAMTLSTNGQKVISSIPRNRILTETDAPFNPKNSISKTIQYLGITNDILYNNFMDLIGKLK
jgi:TatD DNase family protein